MSRHHSSPATGRPRRHALWLLLIPIALFVLLPVVANRIQPMVLGMPFIIFYTVLSTVVTWAAVWVTARLDPLYRDNALESVPADDSDRGAS